MQALVLPLLLALAAPCRAELPERLSQTGLAGEGVRAFEPRFALWSDGAAKRRWIRLPPGTAINLCTAKAPVLAALPEAGGTEFNEELLATNRKEGCFPTKLFLPSMVGESLARQLIDSGTISETTNWFRAVTAVRIGTSEFTLYSLINRNESDTAIRTVLRSTGTE